MHHPHIKTTRARPVPCPLSIKPTRLICVMIISMRRPCVEAEPCEWPQVSADPFDAKTAEPLPPSLSDQGEISDTPPSHYILRIQSFSQLSKHSIQRYTSSDFQAGGYKWKLALHPDGNEDKHITNHVSLYLVFADANLLGPGGQIRAVFRLFLLDQNTDTYLPRRGDINDFTFTVTLQNHPLIAVLTHYSFLEGPEHGRRFHRTKLEWGFDEFIPHADFMDPDYGYLVNDTCVFGAEVYVCQEKPTGKGECLSMVKDAISFKNTWRIDNYSRLTADDSVDSEPFTAAGKKWKIQLYPWGKGSGAGTHMSLYLSLADPENLPPASKIYADFTLRILDQLNGRHHFGNANYWFSASNSTSGWPRFVSHGYFNQSTTGLLVKNACIVEAEVRVKGVANAL